MTTEKKEHWTKSPEGQAKLKAAMKKMWAAKKAGKKVAKRKYTKKAPVKKKTEEQLSITVSGPDTYKAVFLMLTGQHDITVSINEDDDV